MPFQRERLIGLRKAKGIRTQDELEAVTGLARVMLNRYEKGTKTPDADTIEGLADKLDATMGYFHGHGDDYGDDYERAAIQMSFDILSRDKDFFCCAKGTMPTGAGASKCAPNGSRMEGAFGDVRLGARVPAIVFGVFGP